MTDDPTPCPDPVELTVSQTGQPQPVASLDAITTLIHSFASMMSSMEKRLADQISHNAGASKERWERWEREFEKYQRDTGRRIELLEEQHSIQQNRVDALYKEKEHDEIVWDSRLGPVKRAGIWLGRHARDIIIVILGILAVLGFSTEAIQRIMGL